MYDKICNMLINLSIKNPQKFCYKTLSFMELKNLLLEIFDFLFDKKYHDIIKSYNDNLLTLCKIPSPYDSVVDFQNCNDILTPQKIYISNQLASIQIPFTAHEYMHVLLAKYETTLNRKIISNYHYEELLSILIEYIISYEIDKTIYDNLEYKNSIIRIDHNRINLDDQLNMEKMSLKENNEVLNKAIEYQHHLQYKYLIRDMLNYYNISLTNKSTTNTYIKKLEDLRKQ